MGWQDRLGRLGTLLRRDRTERQRGEYDAPDDNAGPRAAGGGPDIGTMDKNSTTGSTENDTFVGRAGGDETGDVGISGAEARGGGPIEGRTGAARDE